MGTGGLMSRWNLRFALLVTLLAMGTSANGQPAHGDGETLGTVHFATSCDESVQTEFNRSVALLHSFQFSRAIAGFNAVLSEDPTCGIVYWGIALSDWSNPFAANVKDKDQLQMGRENAEPSW